MKKILIIVILILLSYSTLTKLSYASDYAQCSDSCDSYFNLAEWCIQRYEETKDKMFLQWSFYFIDKWYECDDICYQNNK